MKIKHHTGVDQMLQQQEAARSGQGVRQVQETGERGFMSWGMRISRKPCLQVESSRTRIRAYPAEKKQ